MARVTVKELRAEARRRVLECGNGKTISRMNKRELLQFLSCIDHPDADNLGGDDLGASVAGMFREPKAQKPKTGNPARNSQWPMTSPLVTCARS